MLSRKRLKTDVVPHVFDGQPTYMSKNNPNKRTNSALSAKRCEKENQLINEMNDRVLNSDRVLSLNDLRNSNYLIPDNFVKIERQMSTMFLLLSDLHSDCPDVLASVIVRHDMKLECFIKQTSQAKCV